MKSTTRIFKANSRIGMKNIPINGTELNLGVEFGPDAILSDEFLAKLKNHSIHEYTFPNPEDIETKKFNEVLVEHITNFKKLLGTVVKPNETQIVIGGDHSVAFPSILAILDRMEDSNEFGYIQIDSHGDMNLAADSPTDNWHGMYLRPLIADDFDIPEITKMVTKKIRPANMIFFGNLDLDVKEREFFEKNKIKNFNQYDLSRNKDTITKFFGHFITKFKHVHVSIDIDGFDKSIASATGIPAEAGLFLEDVTDILNILSKHQSISVDLVEVNPKKTDIKTTATTAQKILKKIIR